MESCDFLLEAEEEAEDSGSSLSSSSSFDSVLLADLGSRRCEELEKKVDYEEEFESLVKEITEQERAKAEAAATNSANVVLSEKRSGEADLFALASRSDKFLIDTGQAESMELTSMISIDSLKVIESGNPDYEDYGTVNLIDFDSEVVSMSKFSPSTSSGNSSGSGSVSSSPRKNSRSSSIEEDSLVPEDEVKVEVGDQVSDKGDALPSLAEIDLLEEDSAEKQDISEDEAFDPSEAIASLDPAVFAQDSPDIGDDITEKCEIMEENRLQIIPLPEDWLQVWASLFCSAILFLVADTVAEFGGWTQTLAAEIKRLSVNPTRDNPTEVKSSLGPFAPEDEESLGPVDLASFVGPASFVDDPPTQIVASLQNAAEPSFEGQLAKTPVPAPRHTPTAAPHEEPPQSIHIYQEEPRNLEKKLSETPNPVEAVEEDPAFETEAEITEPAPEAMVPELKEDSESVLQQPFDSLEASNIARDSIEASPGISVAEPEQTQIVISNSGRWAVENQEHTEEEEVEDDIPEDWKEASDLVPVKRCVRVETSSSESGHATSSDNCSSADEEPVGTCAKTRMEIIEECDEDKTTSGEESNLESLKMASHRITSPELVQQVIFSNVNSEGQLIQDVVHRRASSSSSSTSSSSDESGILNYRVTSSTVTTTTTRQQQVVKPVAKPLTSGALQPLSPETASTFAPKHFSDIEHLEHPSKREVSPVLSHPEEEESRISPAHTVTSNDSGVDPHDEIFSPHGNPNVSVKNIAKFWEEDTPAPKDEESAGTEDEDAMGGKKWVSMPDLKMKKARRSSSAQAGTLYEVEEEDTAALEQKFLAEEERKRQEQEERRRMTRVRVSESAPRSIVRSDYEVDDRDVCTLVPINERRKLFETLSARSLREKKKQWSSMPSLDMPKHKDSYTRHNYGAFSRNYQPPPPNVHFDDKARLYPKANPVAEKKATPIIPLYSSHTNIGARSDPSENYELTPLKDRMRAFQSPEKEPVSKPVLSVPKTVSVSPSAVGVDGHSPQRAVVSPLERKSSANNTLQQTNRSFEHSQPLSPAHSPFAPEPTVEETSSLTDSVASSHTSSSTVISASKINGFGVNSVQPPTGPVSSSQHQGQGHGSVMATYSWNDESNGEIYNDRIDHNEILYVVENGQEFPLTSVSKRKSLFLSTDALNHVDAPPTASTKVNDAKSAKSVKELLQKGEPTILPDHKVKEYHRQEVKVAEERGHREGSAFSDEDDFDRAMRANGVGSAAEQCLAIKSAKVPYIEEEQEVLANINLVKAMKQKFLA